MIRVVEPALNLDLAAVPDADLTAEPQGFVVEVMHGTRIHFLDWGGPEISDAARVVGAAAGAAAHGASDGAAADPASWLPPRVLLLHGLAQTAWAWTPVARRLRRIARVVAMDLRGHGLSDSPTDGYDLDTLADDVVAVADGSGMREVGGSPLVLAGHGFGAIVATCAAQVLGERGGGLVLVDGGWEDLARSTGLEPDEFLRGLAEPPEVLRTMDAYLADRRDFDPGSWDADQEQAARATVVETHAKRLTPATRPHAVNASVAAMFRYDPLTVLPLVPATIAALMSADDEDGTRGAALVAAQRALEIAGRPPMRIARFPDAGHNLMRYRPRQVAAAVLAVAGTLRS